MVDAMQKKNLGTVAIQIYMYQEQRPGQARSCGNVPR